MCALRRREARRSKVPRELTLAELRHLHTLLEEAKEEGSYYGPREQYYARTDRLIEWCEVQIGLRGGYMTG